MNIEKLKYLGKKLAQLDITEFYGTLEKKQEENPKVFEFIYQVVSDDRWEDFTIKEARNRFIELIKSEKIPTPESILSKMFDKMPDFLKDALQAAIQHSGEDSKDLKSKLHEALGEMRMQSSKQKEDAEIIKRKIEKMTQDEKLSELMKYVGILKIDAHWALDRLSDRMKDDVAFFEITTDYMMYAFRDNNTHYKECSCVKDRFEILLKANSIEEAKKLEREHDVPS